MSGIKFIQAKKHTNFRYIIPILVEDRSFVQHEIFLPFQFYISKKSVNLPKKSFCNGLLYETAVGLCERNWYSLSIMKANI